MHFRINCSQIRLVNYLIQRYVNCKYYTIVVINKW